MQFRFDHFSETQALLTVLDGGEERQFLFFRSKLAAADWRYLTECKQAEQDYGQALAIPPIASHRAETERYQEHARVLADWLKEQGLLAH